MPDKSAAIEQNRQHQTSSRFPSASATSRTARFAWYFFIAKSINDGVIPLPFSACK
jgi:hypothetical protein